MSERPPVRVLVCGGRNYADRGRLFAAMDDLHGHLDFSAVIHGGAPGADSLAGEWARSRGVEEIAVPADWKRHGKAAGPRRNQSMLDDHHPTCVVAFPGGKGTADMVRRAASARLGIIHTGRPGDLTTGDDA